MTLSFANPWFLPLLFAVPLLTWWLLRQRHGALRHPGTSLLAGLPAGRSQVARIGGAALRTLAFALLVLALSGPRLPDLKTRLPAEGIALAMVVDVSGSMAEPDFDWDGEPISRLEAVKRVFRLFVAGGETPGGGRLEGRPQDQIALVTFGTRPESPCPLTLSHSVLLGVLDSEQPRSIPGESETNISDALALGLHRLQAAGPRRKVLVLLSDGEHNVPNSRSTWKPRQAAQIAANLGVSVYAIDAGGDASAGGEPGAPDAGAASRAEGVRTLEEIARITRGQYFRARDTQGLAAVCQQIDALERSPVESFQYRRYHEGYPWLALGSFVFLVLAQVLDMTVWRKVP